MFRPTAGLPIGGKPGNSRFQNRPPRAPNGKSASDPPPPAPKFTDDAAHSDEYKNHEHKEWYTEWWYFNVRDPKTGIALLATYAICPFGLGIGGFATCVYPPNAAPFDASDPFGPGDCSASRTRPEVRVGPNHVDAIDENTYRFTAQSHNGRVAWDLTLTRVAAADPSWLLNNAQGPLEWEVGYWMTWLPQARAHGTITIDGVVHTIEDADAYHDHNWGVWCSPARNWQWLQCSSAKDDVALDLGYSDGFDPPRTAILTLGNRTIHFDYSGIEIPTYAGFQNWPGTPWKYPQSAVTTLVDPSDKIRVEVSWSAPENSTLPLYATIVLFEQHVKVTLSVSERGSDGNYQPARVYTIDGIAEWSDSYLAEWSTGEGLLGAYSAEATVFGGGVTGLSVAHELVERGFAVTVVETCEAMDPKGGHGMALGGMARSHYARVPRVGPPPANRPAGRATPDPENDRWGNRSIAFALDSSSIPERAKSAIASAAREFRDTYCDQGYRLRITGSANAVEREPRALAARRAEAIRDVLEAEGIAADAIVLTEDARAGRLDAMITLEDYVLPGEHGFRFFPSYYRHLTDTMARIPVYDEEGRQTHRRVLDNLAATPQQLMLRSGKKPTIAGGSGKTTSPIQSVRMALQAICGDNYDPRDLLQMGLRISRYLATCPERREPLEDMSWWAYLCGLSPKTRCYLYRYSNAFTRDSTQSGRVLAAFDWRYGDARTNGSTWVQLFTPLPDAAGTRFAGTLDAPTTEAWFTHWRRYLEERDVRFVSGSLEKLETHEVDGKDVVIPLVKRAGKTHAEPWIPKTRLPHYVVCATDPSTAEAVSRPLPKVGVPEGLVGFTTRYGKEPRDPHTQPGLGPDDRLQTLSGVQYFFDQNFAIGDHAYSLDGKWSICTLSMQRVWSKIPTVKLDGFAGLLSVDIGDFKVPAGPTQTTAWDSTKEGLAEQVWMQLTNDLRTDAAAPLRLPRPTWFHIDDNLHFGDRDGKKCVVVRNDTPYLVPITSDWEKRPGPAPFDPNVPATPVGKADASPEVWTAPHGGYQVHFGSLVYAGIYLKTFTRMTTMESANESGRHAVNAILDHYNAHHASSVAPAPPPPDKHTDPNAVSADQVLDPYLGDYCGIWNMERYEPSAFDSLKSLDQTLFNLGLPHIFDLLGIEILPSVLSHLFPYRGDCSSTSEAAPPPVPPPAPWCPPFVGDVVSKVSRFFRK